MLSSYPRGKVTVVSFFTMPGKRTLLISLSLVVICLASVHSIASIRGTAISARNSQTRENKIAAGFLKLRAGLPEVNLIASSALNYSSEELNVALSKNKPSNRSVFNLSFGSQLCFNQLRAKMHLRYRD